MNKILKLLILYAVFPSFSLLPTGLHNTGTIDILTQSPWESFESWTDFDGDGIFTLMIEDCKNDNNWTFNQDSVLIVTEDSIKCEPDMPALGTVSCKWMLKKNDTILSLIFTDDEELDLDIYSIGENYLELHISDPERVVNPITEKIILAR